MARFRLSSQAREDLARILDASAERWGQAGMSRYRSLLIAAIRVVASKPSAAASRSRPEVRPGLRSFHVRHARAGRRVNAPVHVIIYRVDETGIVEVVRVLHERMDPSAYVDDG